MPEITREELLAQLTELRTKVAELERLETGRSEEIQVLQQRSGMLQSLMDCSPDPMVVYDAEGRVLFLNVAFAATFGWSNEELQGQRIDYVPEDCLAQTKETLERTFGGEQVPPFDTRRMTKDGRILDVHISSALFTNRLGQPLGHIVTLRDITEKKRTEQALMESEQKYRLVAEHMNDILWTVDLNMRTTFVSPSIEKVLGFTPEERFQQDMRSQLTAESLLSAEETLLDELRRDKEQGVDPDRCTVLELDFLHKNGTIVCLESVLRFIRDEKGNAIGIHGVSRDVTMRKRAEEAMRESEERYREIVESANDIIYQSDNRGIVTFANRLALKISGYSKEEFIGKHYLEFIEPDYRAQAERFYGIQFVKKLPTTYNELPVLTKQQETLWVGQNVQLMMEGDAVVGFRVIARDITKRKRVEQALAESERRFREVLEKVDLLAATIDVEGQIIFCNDFLLGLTGWRREEVLGKNWFQIFVGLEQREARLKAHFEFMKEGRIPIHRENEIVKRDGSARFIRWTNTLLHDHDGKVIGTTGIGEDITDKRQAEEALRESEEKCRKILENIADGYHETDLKGNLTLVNDSLCQIAGYSREELVGLSYRRLMDEQNAKLIFNAYNEVYRTGKSNPGVGYQIIRKDGEKRDIVVSVALIRDKEGNGSGFRGIFRDVTDQIRLQRQLLHAQKVEAIGTLAGGIAHDFNNLLQAILGYSELLLMKKPLGDPDRKKLEGIQHAARDGADLVSRILMFSRKTESKVRPIDLNEEIRRVEKLLRRTLPRMVQIDLALGEDLRIIDADPAQIEQVLLNLAVNAQHAMPDGGQLLIETNNVSLSDEYVLKHLGAVAGKYVLLTVSDTGVGMKPDVLDRIFEPFFTTKTDAGGTGLGLSIVHGIVSQHGGYIRCYTEPGRGTSFKIYFPVSATGHISDLAKTREMPAFGTETILLVDDDDRVREMARQMIEMGGYEVLAARSGEEALGMYESHRGEISLIILDLIMPGMGGSRCLEELLRIDPDVRVLVASGYSSNGLTQDQKGRGARGFVNKPYDAKDILIAIRKVLDKGHL